MSFFESLGVMFIQLVRLLILSVVGVFKLGAYIFNLLFSILTSSIKLIIVVVASVLILVFIFKFIF